MTARLTPYAIITAAALFALVGLVGDLL